MPIGCQETDTVALPTDALPVMLTLPLSLISCLPMALNIGGCFRFSTCGNTNTLLRTSYAEFRRTRTRFPNGKFSLAT
jgi:hypothetical protein